jgi:SAM-dependent methyltransferase
MLFSGFDDLDKGRPSVLNATEVLNPYGQMIHDALQRVAVASGALRFPYPPGNDPLHSIEDLLNSLDDLLGFRIEFPNPFRYEFGLATSRGIANFRAIQSVYQAWRTKLIAQSLRGDRILEIGAGLGRNAYYAQKLGFQSYTIVDVPSTQLAQGYFLGRVIGSDSVSLHGEQDEYVRLRSPTWLANSNEVFDIVLNVDSLSEMDRAHASAYVEIAKRSAKAFLSINHEHNPFTVRELLIESEMHPVSRSVYWPRPGYIEELYISQASDLHALNQRLVQDLLIKRRMEKTLSAEAAALRSSTSWRITAPLRTIRNAFSRL